jgi:thiamine kinase-like enzyme
MPWPTPQDYNEALQNPGVSLADEELRSGEIEHDKFGLPKAITGSYASVYGVQCGDKKFAVRCLLHDFPDQQMRYQRLSQAICSDFLECTVDFEFVPEGIRIGNERFPIIKMLWVQGKNLDHFIQENNMFPDKMRKLRQDFQDMAKALREAGFAHGDLQHGNIIISEQGIRLVDYDGMYVPALSGLFSHELGHRNFQHPRRAKEHFGPFLDNFSTWVIDTALACLIADPNLFAEIRAKNEAILFRQTDFLNPAESEIFYLLEKHESEEIRRASRSLRTALNCLPFNVPPLTNDVPQAERLTRIVEEEKIALRVAEWALDASLEKAERDAQRQAANALALEKARALEELERVQKQRPNWLDEGTEKDLLENSLKGDVNENSSGSLKGAGPSSINSYPTKFEYISALQNQRVSLELVTAKIEQDQQQILDFGHMHVVAHITGDKAEALKFFTHEIINLDERIKQYNRVLASIPKSSSRFLLAQDLLQQAIFIDNNWYPALKTPWQQNSLSLENYLLTQRPDFDFTMLNNFRRLAESLHANGLAHGSLEPENILVKNQTELILVDYDNFYTGAESIYEESDGPSKNFRHPLWQAQDFGLNMDNFQFWQIDTILMCWSMARTLWAKHAGTHNTLFFKEADLKSPNNSELFDDLLNHQLYEISERAKFLLEILNLPPGKIPRLSRDGTLPT